VKGLRHPEKVSWDRVALDDVVEFPVPVGVRVVEEVEVLEIPAWMVAASCRTYFVDMLREFVGGGEPCLRFELAMDLHPDLFDGQRALQNFHEVSDNVGSVEKGLE